MIVKSKFMLTSHTHQGHGPSADWHSHEFEFTPQYDPNLPEDQRFNKATPNGKLTIRVDNPPVVEFWTARVGKQFYVNFTEADTEQSQ